MAIWNLSAVFVCQAADQEDSNTIALALDYGPNTFSQPAGPEGATAPTHYFNHSWAAQEFADMVTALGEGTAPEGLPVELLPALSRMIISIRDGGDPVAHVDEVLVANNLVRL